MALCFCSVMDSGTRLPSDDRVLPGLLGVLEVPQLLSLHARPETNHEGNCTFTFFLNFGFLSFVFCMKLTGPPLGPDGPTSP